MDRRNFVKKITLGTLLTPLANRLPLWAQDANAEQNTWYSLVSEKHRGNASFQYVVNNKDLPNVFIYGDSISIHYTPYLRDLLKEKANVYRLHMNGGDSASLIPKMESMLQTMRPFWTFNFDVIHFNVGLHDLKYTVGNKLDKANGNQVRSVSDYKIELEKDIKWLKSYCPDAKLIFATTTPVPEGEAGRYNGDAVRYNKAAQEVLSVYPEIEINDLYKFTLPHHAEWWAKEGNVHYNETGRIQQAKEVARHIVKNL